MLEWLVIAPSLIFCVAIALQLWPNPRWQIRDLDFPRLQMAALGAVIIVMQAVMLPLHQPEYLLLLGVTALGLAYQLLWIMPYSQLWREEVGWADPNGQHPKLSIMTANVLTPNRQAQRLVSIVREQAPDVLVLLETDQWWEAQMDVLLDRYPHCIRCPLDNLYGMNVYSRLPLDEAKVDFLVEPNVPSMHASVRVNEELSVRMHFLHPAPPSPTENVKATERDAELIIVARSIRSSEGPVIVAGDLNDVAWSPTTRLFRKISNLLDPRVGRGMFNTYNAKHRLFRWPLDHFFHSKHFKLLRISRLPAFGSDHFPIFIELAYDQAYRRDQSSLPREEADRRRAQAIVDQVDADSSSVPRPGRRQK